jgi:hypothetical protein
MAIPNSKLLILASESLKEFKLSNVTLAFKDSPGLEHISPRAQWIVDEPVAMTVTRIRSRNAGSMVIPMIVLAPGSTL